MLQEFIYTSAARARFDASALKTLLERARRNNARLNVTGILLYHERSFLQVLEGEPETLAALSARIRDDPRHDRFRVLRQAPIERRSFGNWSMGLVSLDPTLLLPGRHGLSSNGSLLEDEASVLALLEAFRAGQHHAHVIG